MGRKPKVIEPVRGKNIMVDDISTQSDSPVVLSPSAAEREIKRQEERQIKIQEEIDKYNANLSNIDERFNKFTFISDQIIVKLKKIDYIKKVEGGLLGNFVVRKEAKIPYQVQRGNNVVTEHMDNPLPYRYEGIICNVPKHVKEAFKERTGVELKEGMEIQLSSIDLSNCRFYFNKEDVEHFVSLEDAIEGQGFVKHEGFFKIYANDIESIVLDKK